MRAQPPPPAQLCPVAAAASDRIRLQAVCLQWWRASAWHCMAAGAEGHACRHAPITTCVHLCLCSQLAQSTLWHGQGRGDRPGHDCSQPAGPEPAQLCTGW